MRPPGVLLVRVPWSRYTMSEPMGMRRRRIVRGILVCMLLWSSLAIGGHDVVAQLRKRLTLDECLVYAREYSSQAMQARHQFLLAHWRYRGYRAQYLPSVKFTGGLPDFNRRLVRYQLPDGSYSYVSENANDLSLGLTLTQRIGTTGANLYVRSNLNRVDVFGLRRRTDYMTVPVQVGLEHNFFALNTLKWDRRIEPKRYEEAKRTYMQTLEEISLEAINYFFDLLHAQQSLAIARLNRMNADTLYRIAKGRYNIGTIAENDLLQMELNHLNATHAVNEGQVQLKVASFKLQSFLGLNEEYEWEVEAPVAAPVDSLLYDSVMTVALARNPGILAKEREGIEARRGIAQARADMGYSLSLALSYGLTQQAQTLPAAYRIVQDQQGLRVAISVPILDWGQGRGRLRIAQSNYEIARMQGERYRQSFMQEVFLQVMRYNLLNDQLMLAAKADTIAQNRYYITKQRFLTGKVDVLELDKAQVDRDAARLSYIRAVQSYWQVYYTLRRTTLYDPGSRKELMVDFEALLR